MPEDFKADASNLDLSNLWEDDEPKPEKAPPAKADLLRGEEEGMIMNPLTGELINTDDIDALIAAAIEVKSLLVELRFFGQNLRNKALELSEGDKKTRRLRGKTMTAKLENCGSVYPVGSILKEAWLSYPQYREQYMRIDNIALKLVEFNKLAQTTTDDKAFQSFKDMLERAVSTGSPVTPSITLENDESEKIS